MIIAKNLTIKNKAFVKTCSDSGYMIERDGARYSEAIDPAYMKRVYTETNVPIDVYMEEATESDYQDALRDMGVEV